MLFNSIEFVFYFFPLVTIAFFLLPHKFRWLLLLIASCYFYMFFIPYYILILGFTIIVDYKAGILIEEAPTQARRKLFLMASLIANIGVLCIFKYYNFFIENVNEILKFKTHSYQFNALSIILPVGLSFHTFQAMSYTIEVYRKEFKAERHFGIYALYVMFYPQLVAGPIERPQNILPQLHEEQFFNSKKFTSGLLLIVWGLLKKVVIADRIAGLIEGPFSNPENFSGMNLYTASCLFAIQIYCDFSGYSDIAIGTARCMGIDLMRNFKTPYFSKTVSEFWNRWHISLSTWFKDYVYIPLGGNRHGYYKWIRNLLIVFIISGIWHGANWTFIIWGAIHGIYLCIGILNSKANFKFKTQIPFLNTIIVFNLVTLAWIFFRSENLNKAFKIIHNILFALKISVQQLFTSPQIFLNDFIASCLHQISEFGLSTFFLIAGLLLFERFIDLNTQTFTYKKHLILFITMLMMIIVLGSSTKEKFIYFQF